MTKTMNVIMVSPNKAKSCGPNNKPNMMNFLSNIFNIKKEAMYVFFHCFNSEYAKKLVGEYEAEFIYNLVKKND